MKNEIESALLAANGSRAGASVPVQSRAVRQQMIECGLMTEKGNLTALGAVTRSSVSILREDEAFG